MKYIVQGNFSKFKVTLTQKCGELIQPYIPTATCEVKISLRGERVYEYKEYEQSSNVLTFADNGYLKVGMYELEVRIIDSEQHRLRCMYREQVMVVASNDDIPTNASFEPDDIQLSGQFDIAASVKIVIDDELSDTSENPVQNKVVTAALNMKGDALAGDITAAGYEIDLKSGNTSLSQVYVPFAYAQTDGLMSSTDFSKLAGIAAGATRVIVDTAFDTTSANAISNSAVATALGDIDTILDNILGN